MQQEELRSKARHELFSHGKWARKFQEDFSKRDILIGKKCDLNALNFINFSTLFEEMGWETLIGINTYIYPRLVRAFFACIEIACDPYCIKGTLKGVRFTITVDSLNELLNAPNEGLLLDPRPRLKNDAYYNHASFTSIVCVGEDILDKPKRHNLTL